MADFVKYYRHLRQYEGGLANVKGDSGGYTYAGISRNNWPDWPGWNIIDQYKKSGTLSNKTLAKDTELQKLHAAFFLTEYWNAAGMNKAPGLDDDLAAAYMDGLIMSGLNSSASRLIVDSVARVAGVDGDSLTRVKALELAQSLPVDKLATEYYKGRKSFYEKIATGDRAKFLNGWLNRLSASLGGKSGAVVAGGSIGILIALIVAYGVYKSK